MTWLHAFALIAFVEGIVLASALAVVSTQRDVARRRLETLRVQNRQLLKSLPINGYNLDVPSSGVARPGPYRVDISW